MKVISPSRKVQLNSNWKKKTKKSQGSTHWLLIFLLLYIFSFLYLIIFSGFFKIQKFELSLTDETLKNEISVDVAKFLNSRWIPFIKKEDSAVVFSLVGNGEKLENLLKNRYLKLDSVDVSLGLFGGHILSVGATIRNSIGSWCDVQNQCFDFDKNRLAFQLFDSKAIWKIYDQQKQIKLGESVTENEELFLKMLEAKKVLDLIQVPKYQYFIIPPQTVGEFWVKVLDGWIIYLDQTVDIKTQILGMKEVYETIDKNRGIEYFDLRVRDRVYYK